MVRWCNIRYVAQHMEPLSLFNHVPPTSSILRVGTFSLSDIVINLVEWFGRIVRWDRARSPSGPAVDQLNNWRRALRMQCMPLGH